MEAPHECGAGEASGGNVAGHDRTRIYPAAQRNNAPQPSSYAARLAGAGIAVFPCQPNKRPYTANGFHDATTEQNRIKDWWGAWPAALVGVPTGPASGLLVVDVDPDGAEWFADNFPRLAAGRIHQTRRGRHLLYRCPDPAPPCSASKVAPGIDVRATGGYVIWWPASGMRTIGGMDDIGPLPDWLLEAISPASCPVKTPADWRQIAAGAAEGSRNCTLARLVGHLLQRGVRATVARELCLAWAQSRCRPPMDLAEAERTIESIVRKDVARLRGRA